MQVGSQEFRCCSEVVHSSGKIVFDGSIERIKCITQHKDYAAITNRAVLQQVAPLLQDKSGRTYQQPVGYPKTNDYVLFGRPIKT